jgi:ATP-dependent Clp protease ATP-binding subunit ClpC
MKTLWQQILNFIEPLLTSLRAATVEFTDPHAGDEKVKRKRSPNKVERFTMRSRRVLGLAQEAAERLEHASIRPEHLLLGLIYEIDGIAGLVLKDLNVQLDQAEALVVTFSDAEERKDGLNLQLSSESKKLLEFSVDEARRLGDFYIGTAHLLALVRLPEGPTTKVLDGLGVTSAQIRTHILDMIDEEPEEE